MWAAGAARKRLIAGGAGGGILQDLCAQHPDALCQGSFLQLGIDRRKGNVLAKRKIEVGRIIRCAMREAAPLPSIKQKKHTT